MGSSSPLGRTQHSAPPNARAGPAGHPELDTTPRVGTGVLALLTRKGGQTPGPARGHAARWAGHRPRAPAGPRVRHLCLSFCAQTACGSGCAGPSGQDCGGRAVGAGLSGQGQTPRGAAPGHLHFLGVWLSLSLVLPPTFAQSSGGSTDQQESLSQDGGKVGDGEVCASPVTPAQGEPAQDTDPLTAVLAHRPTPVLRGSSRGEGEDGLFRNAPRHEPPPRTCYPFPLKSASRKKLPFV